MCRPKQCGFSAVLVWQNGVDFAHSSLESGMVFEGITGMYEGIYRFNSNWVRKKEKYADSIILFVAPVLSKVMMT